MPRPSQFSSIATPPVGLHGVEVAQGGVKAPLICRIFSGRLAAR
jgi:hypothetical protein